MASTIIPTNQIAKIQTNKKLISVTGKWSMPTRPSYRGSRHMHSIQAQSDSKTSRDKLRVTLKKILHILVTSMNNDQVIIIVKVSISTQNHNISIIILIIRGTYHEQYKSLPGSTSVSRQ